MDFLTIGEENGFCVKMIADSISPDGVRICTVTARYPRFIHCYDDQTDVLCEVDGCRAFRSWVAIADLPYGHVKLAAWSPNGSIEFEVPDAVITKPHNGDVLESNNQRLSFCVTPQHRMYVGCRKSWGDSWEIETAEQMEFAPQRRFKTTGVVKDGKQFGRLLSELTGFFVGDGSILPGSQQATFHLKKHRKIKYLHAILRELNIEFRYTPYSDGTSNTVFSLDSVPILRKCYAPDGQKTIPNEITIATAADLVGFLDGLWHSDGSTPSTGKGRVHNTSSPYVADALSTIATMCGKRINLTEMNERGMFKLIESSEISPVLRTDKNPIVRRSYSGMVYCATVSTGLLVVRRNGRTLVSGNCELMTHRAFARNAASSRAIPFKKMVEAVMEHPVIPIKWGAEQKGMQTGDEIGRVQACLCKDNWLTARDHAVRLAEEMHEQGLHKSICNRILEPFAWITTVITATEWNNFFRLRCHEHAEIHLQKTAYMLRDLLQQSTPQKLDYGDWHLPFISPVDIKEIETAYPAFTFDDVLHIACKVSSARGARVSYLTHHGTREIAKDLELFGTLSAGSGFGHWSPMEHPARCEEPGRIEAIKEDGTRELYSKFHSFYGPFKNWKQYRKFFTQENLEGCTP